MPRAKLVGQFILDPPIEQVVRRLMDDQWGGGLLRNLFGPRGLLGRV